MAYLQVTLMNRLNKTEAAAFIFLMLFYFTENPVSDNFSKT